MSIQTSSGGSDTSERYPQPPNIAEIRSRFKTMAEGAEVMLRRSGFVVLGDVSRPTLDQAYPKYGADQSVFVTTDALLALWYGLHRRLLTGAEQSTLAPSLARIVPALINAGQLLAAQQNDGQSQATLDRALLLLAVAQRLLDDSATLPADVETASRVIAAKVLAHQEQAAYPGEDFTQYAVRGHYADTPALARYFRASLWLSRQFQSVTPAPDADPDAPLRTAVALAGIVRAAPDARSALVSLNHVRQTLTGRPNAISVEQLLTALAQELGPHWTLDQAMRPATLTALRQRLGQAEYPRVLVQTRFAWPDTPFPNQIVSLLPDSALPDSALFQNTVNPKVPERSLPTGLEVAAALGFDNARVLLRTIDAQADAVLTALDGHTPLVSPGDISVYDGWLRMLATLPAVPPGAPDFMNSSAWQSEKLNTALASWTQARHNYVLYGAQTYAVLLSSEFPHPGMVEANPAFFRSLAALAYQTRETLASANALSAPNAAHIQALETQCLAFAADAEAEIAGTLSQDRSEAISRFGDWLEQFQLQTGPIVADVATGLRGEVRHVATGGFHPLIVIPDAQTGTAYVGWTLSYYEFSRPAGDRMTDADWQRTLDAPYLRPARPEWTEDFVFQDRGPTWQSRAPLRQAETLFLTHRAEEALTLLRSIVAMSPESTVAVEAQYRLGRYYEESEDSAQALTEYLKCRRLPGCEAADLARERAISLVNALWIDERQTAEAEAPKRLPNEEAQALLTKLRHTSLSSEQQEEAERELVNALVRAYAMANDWKTKTPDLLIEALAVCRVPERHELLRYLRLTVRMSDAAEMSTATRQPELMAFIQSAHSPALKAAAFWIAVRDGSLADEPDQLLFAMPPFPSFEAPGTDPVYALLKSVEGGQLFFNVDPESVVGFNASEMRDQLVQKAYAEGRFEDMIRYYEAFPRLPFSHDSADFYMDIYQSYPDFDGELLRLKIRADALSRTSPDSAVALYKEIAEQYPSSHLALLSLQTAETLLRQNEQTAQADAVRATILQTHGGSPLGLLYQAQDAVKAGDVEAALALLDQMPRQDQDPVAVDAKGKAIDLRRQIEQAQELLDVLQPFVPVAEQPSLPDIISAMEYGNILALVDRIADALPTTQAVEIHLALMRLRRYRNSIALLSLHALAHTPDGIHAAQLWENLTGETARMQSVASELAAPHESELAAAFLNRGPDYAYASQALTLFKNILGSGRWGQEESGPLENLKSFAAHHSLMRAGQAASCVCAQALLMTGRPEEAQVFIANTGRDLAADDSIHAEADLLRRRAARELWAKRQPDWSPLWQTQVGPQGSSVIEFDAPKAMVGVLGSSLVVLWVGDTVADDHQSWQGLAGLDPATGEVQWRTIIGALRDVAGAAGRVFAVTRDGGLAALDAATGHILYRQPFAAETGRSQPKWTLATDRRLITISGSAVAGLDPATGRALWIHPWVLTGESGSADRPTLIGETLYCVTKDGHLRAVDTETGAILWDRVTNSDETIRRVGIGQPFAAGTVYLVTKDETLQTWNATDGTPYPPARRLPAWVRSRELIANGDYLVKWNQNTSGDVSRLPDLSPIPIHLPPKGSSENGLLRGSTLYIKGQGQATRNPVFQALDVTTGALLGWWPVRNAPSTWVSADEQRVYLASADGRVLTFPFFLDPPENLPLG